MNDFEEVHQRKHERGSKRSSKYLIFSNQHFAQYVISIMSSRLSLLWRPLKGSVVWTAGGVGSAWFIPPVLTSMNVIYSSGLIATSMYGGTFVILLPLGLTRGVLGEVQAIVQSSETSLQSALLAASASSSTPRQQFSHSSKEWLERFTLGSGVQGQVLRTLVSPFMPSTAQMLVRVQQELDKGARAQDSHVVAAAVSGYVDGFLQDKKDTITMVGLIAYSLVLGVGFGLDYSYRKMDEKQQALKEKYRERAESVKEAIHNSKENMSKLIDTLKKEGEAKNDAAQQKIAKIKESLHRAREGLDDLTKSETSTPENNEDDDSAESIVAEEGARTEGKQKALGRAKEKFVKWLSSRRQSDKKDS